MKDLGRVWRLGIFSQWENCGEIAFLGQASWATGVFDNQRGGGKELRLIYLLHNLVQTSKLKPNSLW